MRSNRIMRPGTAPARPPPPPPVGSLDKNKSVSFRRASFVNRNTSSSASKGKSEDQLLDFSDVFSSMTLGPHQSLTTSELESIRSCWESIVVNKYRSTIESKDELLGMFQALNVNFLPEVEAQTLRLFASTQYRSRVEFDDFVSLVGQCKMLHLQHMKENPQLCDDLVDAFVALGGQWDTKGSLDNDKMRRTIKQYDLKIDFDRFLETVDTDGNAEVDFDEFKMLVDESQSRQQPEDIDIAGEGSSTTLIRQTSGNSFSVGLAEEVSPTLSDASSSAHHFQPTGNSSPHSMLLQAKQRKVIPTPLNQSDVDAGPSAELHHSSGGVSKHTSVADLGSTKMPSMQQQRYPSVYHSGTHHSSTVDPSSPLTAAGSAGSGQWTASSTKKEHGHHPHHKHSHHHHGTGNPSGGGGVKGAGSPTRSFDPLTRLAHKVASVVSRPSPSVATEGELSIPKPLAVGTLYHELSKAITSVWDIASFRERCAQTMRSADRSGNDPQQASDHPSASTAPNSRPTSAGHDRFSAEVAGAVNAHKLRHKDSAFINRMCAERKSKEANAEEHRAAIEERKLLETREKKLRKRRAELKDKAVAHVISAVPGMLAPSSNSPEAVARARSASMGSSSNLRDLSVRSSSMNRRRSAALTTAMIEPTIPEGLGNDDDDGVGSVYSTSSSQRSDDEKRVAFNFVHLMKSGRSTPVMDSIDGTEQMSYSAEGGAMPNKQQLPFPPSTTGGRRRQSTQQQQKAALGYGASSAGGASSPLTKTLAKIKLRERLFLLAQPTMRLGGNSNQVRLERVRPNPEQDEAAKAKARVPQVPAAKLTPRMRARVAGLTVGEKKEVCRVDEAGHERNELNAKLYECYHGRF
ncbi:Hypothetical protein, putative [Bodo saltans]|uniref:EF-hand domain-containing protein n=1 Tax=Bodo saltans TaxID=75058 RepID=A0A0S4JSL8_BODSA|nr:Hypothetical protein, putative [Bodo saltans]|eukprot:CUG92332.1 Hypothetical protein, putative [Bodo saltans]